MKELLADLHTHSIISVHAFNTITELLDKTTIPYVAVTDHAIDFGNPMLNFHADGYISDIGKYFGDEPRLIHGVELDIDTAFENLCNLSLDKIPLILLSYHGNIDFSAERYIEYIDKVKPTIIAHPYRFANTSEFQQAWREVLHYAVSRGCVIEINEKSVQNLDYKVLQELNCSFSLGSDAHAWTKVGKFDKVLDFVHTYLTNRHIVNYDKDWLETARLGKFNAH